MTTGYQYWNNLIDSIQRVSTVNFPNSIYFGTNASVPQQSFQAKWQFRDDLSITRGKHTFKLGLDYLWEPKLGGFFEYNPTPNITFLDLPSVILSDTARYPQGFSTAGAVTGISATAGNPYFVLSAKMFGVYVQDDWKVSRRLTLNLGLRWDKDFNLIGGANQQKNRAYLALKSIGSPYAGRLPRDDNKDFSPRIGFAYDFLGTGRHVLRGGFGIYYGQIFMNIPLFMLQQANPTIFGTVFYLTSAGPGDQNADLVPGLNKPLSEWRYGVDPLPPIPPPLKQFQGGEVGQIIDPDYHNPYTLQFNLGYTFQINNANSIEVDYVHSLGLREAKTYDINPKSWPWTGRGPWIPRLPGRPAGAGTNLHADFVRPVSLRGLNFLYRRRLTRRYQYQFKLCAEPGRSVITDRRRHSTIRHWITFTIWPLATGSDAERYHASRRDRRILICRGHRISTTLQAESARPYNAIQGIDVLGQGAVEGNHAILLKSRPDDYRAAANMEASDLRTCLAAGVAYRGI